MPSRGAFRVAQAGARARPSVSTATPSRPVASSRVLWAKVSVAVKPPGAGDSACVEGTRGPGPSTGAGSGPPVTGSSATWLPRLAGGERPAHRMACGDRETHRRRAGRARAPRERWATARGPHCRHGVGPRSRPARRPPGPALLRSLADLRSSQVSQPWELSSPWCPHALLSDPPLAGTGPSRKDTSPHGTVNGPCCPRPVNPRPLNPALECGERPASAGAEGEPRGRARAPDPPRGEGASLP